MKINNYIQHWANIITEDIDDKTDIDIQKDDQYEKIRRNRSLTAKEFGQKEPINQGFSQGAKEIPADKFYLNTEPEDEGGIIYAIFQIIQLYRGRVRVPSGVNPENLLAFQWELDMGKYVGKLLGQDEDYFVLNSGWSNNNTDHILRLCVDYFKQPKPKDATKLKNHLKKELDRQKTHYKGSFFKESEIDVDPETWKDDMGRRDDRFEKEFIKGTNEKFRNILNKIEKLSEGTKTSLISWLMDILAGSFKTKAEFDNTMKRLDDDKTRSFVNTSLHREILDAISHQIGELHYQQNQYDIDKELD